MTVVIPVVEMDDESLMKHLENRHPDDLAMEFKAEPGRDERRTHAPDEWRAYHDALHRLYPRAYEHTHRGLVRG